MNRNWRIAMKTKNHLVWILLTMVWCFGLSSPGVAQNWYSALTYQISFPTGDTKDFTDAVSYRGFGLDFRKAIGYEATVGMVFGWNIFYENTNETIELKNTPKPGAVTGEQNRYLYSFPIMINAHRYFGERRGFRPYVGMCLGGYVFVQRFEIGIIALEDSPWEWGMAPEVGFVLPIDGAAMLLVSTKYNYAFTGELVTGKDINHSFWNLNIGFAWGGGRW
jgi:outer membrane protein W